MNPVKLLVFFNVLSVAEFSSLRFLSSLRFYSSLSFKPPCSTRSCISRISSFSMSYAVSVRRSIFFKFSSSRADMILSSSSGSLNGTSSLWKSSGTSIKLCLNSRSNAFFQPSSWMAFLAMPLGRLYCWFVCRDVLVLFERLERRLLLSACLFRDYCFGANGGRA